MRQETTWNVSWTKLIAGRKWYDDDEDEHAPVVLSNWKKSRTWHSYKDMKVWIKTESLTACVDSSQYEKIHHSQSHCRSSETSCFDGCTVLFSVWSYRGKIHRQHIYYVGMKFEVATLNCGVFVARCHSLCKNNEWRYTRLEHQDSWWWTDGWIDHLHSVSNLNIATYTFELTSLFQ